MGSCRVIIDVEEAFYNRAIFLYLFIFNFTSLYLQLAIRGIVKKNGCKRRGKLEIEKN